MERYIRIPEFLGQKATPETNPFIFKRTGERQWYRYDNKEGWQQIIDRNVVDGLEAGYAYGREYLRWQFSQCRD